MRGELMNNPTALSTTILRRFLTEAELDRMFREYHANKKAGVGASLLKKPEQVAFDVLDAWLENPGRALVQVVRDHLVDPDGRDVARLTHHVARAAMYRYIQSLNNQEALARFI